MLRPSRPGKVMRSPRGDRLIRISSLFAGHRNQGASIRAHGLSAPLWRAPAMVAAVLVSTIIGWLIGASGPPGTPASAVNARCAAVAMLSKKQQLDAESDQRLMAALGLPIEEEQLYLDDSEDLLDALYDEDDLGASTDIASHQQLQLDEEGQPLLLRFAYVDEPACIGCTYCADVARNTFYMNEDAGRARVFMQGGDDPEVVQEAIDACPVNCISYIDLEDLVILETEREGMVINPMTIGIPATWSARMNSLPPTKAKLGGSSMMCCNNCPGRGCKECPMCGAEPQAACSEPRAPCRSVHRSVHGACGLQVRRGPQPRLHCAHGGARGQARGERRGGEGAGGEGEDREGRGRQQRARLCRRAARCDGRRRGAQRGRRAHQRRRRRRDEGEGGRAHR